MIRRVYLTLCFLSCIYLFSCKKVLIPQKPEQYVLDNAEILHLKEKAKLDAILRGYEKQTEYQIYILIVENSEASNIGSFCEEVAKTWEIGKNNGDKSVLIALFLEEQRFHLEINKGLSKVITAQRVERIEQEFVYPLLIKKAYYQLLLEAVTALQIYIKEFGENNIKTQMASYLK